MNDVTVFDNKRVFEVEMYEKFDYEHGPEGNGFMIVIRTDRDNDRTVVLQGEEADNFITMLEKCYKN